MVVVPGIPVAIFVFFVTLFFGHVGLFAQTNPSARSSETLFPAVSEAPADSSANSHPGVSGRSPSRPATISFPDSPNDARITPKSERKINPPYTVFVPVDEEDRESGGFVYISLEMLDELKRVNESVLPSMNRWYIRSAKYEGAFELNPHPLTAGMSVSKLKATFEIELETENAVLVFPDIPLIPVGARWDGQPISFRYIDDSGSEQSVVSRANPSPNPGGQSTPGLPMPQGQGARTSADDARKYLLFNVEQQSPGKHTLEVQLNVSVEKTDETGRRLLIGTLPKVADAVFELTLAPNAPTVSIGEARGQILNEPGKMIAKLGPVDRFTLAWNEAGRQFGQPVVECDQSFLLIARTNQLEVIAQHRFRITGGKVSELEIAADPRMQLGVTPPTCIASSEPVHLVRVERNSASSGLTPLIFEKPISGTLTIQANYLLRNFTGIGAVRFPHIQSSKTRVTRSWLGICAESGLEIENPHDATLTPDRFLQDWHEKPQERLLFTYDLAGVDPSWMFSIRTKAVTLRTKTRQSFLLRLNRTESVFRATVEPTGPMFRHCLFVPEHFEVERIDLKIVDQEEKTSVPARWVFQNDFMEAPGSGIPSPRYRIVSIFSERPLSGTHEILVSGRQQPDNFPERALPLFVLDGEEPEESRVDLFHDPFVIRENARVPEKWIPVQNTTVVRSEDWSDAVFTKSWTLPSRPSSEKSSGTPNAGTPVAEVSDAQSGKQPEDLSRGLYENESHLVFRSKNDEVFIPKTAVFSVLPNTPEVTGTIVTKLDRHVDQERFRLVTVLELEISRGELHTLRLSYDDPALSLPTTVPPMNPTLRRDGERRDLLLQPPKPLTGKVRVALDALLNSSGENITLPKIVPEPALSLKHYLVLPGDMHQRPIEWEKKQLLPAEPGESERLIALCAPDSSDSVVPGTSGVGQFEVYLVSGTEYSARINPRGNRSVVQLHDASFYLRKNGSLSGVSTFELRGEGADHCVLALPRPYELVSVTIGGITSRGTFLSQGRWKIDIWPDALPQRIVVVFRGNLASEFFSERHSVDFFPREFRELVTRERADDEPATERLLAVTETNASSRTPSPHAAPGSRETFTPYSPNELQKINVPLPTLESTVVLGTIWTFAFETPDERYPPQYYVAQVKRGTDPDESLPGTDSFSRRDRIDDDAAETYREDVAMLREKLEEKSVRPLALRTAIQGVLQMDLVRLYNLESMMTHAAHSASGTSPEHVSRWYSNWGRRWWRLKREADSLLSIRDVENQRQWKTALFRDDELPPALSEILDSPLTPERIGLLRTGIHDTTTVTLNLQSEDRELAEADYSESNMFSAFRMSQSEHSSYLFGAVGDEVLELRLYAVPRSRGILDEPAIRWSLVFLVGLGTLILARSFHPVRVFRQFPFFLGHVFAIVLWLIFPPGFIGLALLPFLWIAMFWPAWRRSTDMS